MHGKHGRRALSTEVYAQQGSLQIPEPSSLAGDCRRGDPRAKLRVRSRSARGGVVCGVRRGRGAGRRSPAARPASGAARDRRPPCRSGQADVEVGRAVRGRVGEDGRRRRPTWPAAARSRRGRGSGRCAAAASSRGRRRTRAARARAGRAARRPAPRWRAGRAGRSACEPPGRALAAIAGRPALGVVRMSVPSAATGTRWLPATTAPIGLRSCTAIRRRWGKSASVETRRTPGYGSTAVRSSSWRTCSVVMSRAASASASRTLVASGPLTPVTVTSRDRDERGVAQPQPGAAEDGEHGEERGRRPDRRAGQARRQRRAAHPVRSSTPRPGTLPVRAVASRAWRPPPRRSCAT